MSSFQQQLSNLQKDQPRFQSDKEKASLLFQFSEAAGFSIDSIHSIALNGFLKLEKFNMKYTQFKELFSDEYKQFDRQLLTKAENQQLSQKLQLFLFLLSNDFLNINCQKVLEYLIKAFDVHIFENNSIFILFLHYHNHPIFTKLAQNLSTSQHIQFISQVVAQGNIIPRQLIVKQISFDIWILDKLIQDLKIEFNEQRAKFIAAISFDLLEKKLSDALMNRILNISSHFVQLKNVGGIMIFIQIVMMQNGLKQEVIDTFSQDIINQLAQTEDISYMKQIILSLNVLVFHKKLKQININSLLDKNFNIQLFLQTFEQISKEQYSLIYLFVKIIESSLLEPQFLLIIVQNLLPILDNSLESFFPHILSILFPKNIQLQQSPLIQFFQQKYMPEFTQYLIKNNHPLINIFPQLALLLSYQDKDQSISQVFHYGTEQEILNKLEQINQNWSQLSLDQKPYFIQKIQQLYERKQLGGDLLVKFQENDHHKLIKLVKANSQKINLEQFFLKFKNNNDTNLVQDLLYIYLKNPIKLNSEYMFLHNFNQNIKQLIQNDNTIIDSVIKHIKQNFDIDNQIQIIKDNIQLLNNQQILQIFQNNIDQQDLSLLLQSNLQECLKLFKQKCIDNFDAQTQLKNLHEKFNDNSLVNMKICAFIIQIISKNQILNQEQIFIIISKALIRISQQSNRIEKLTFINLINYIKKKFPEFKYKDFGYQDLKQLQKSIKLKMNELSLNQIQLSDIIEKHKLQNIFQLITKYQDKLFNQFIQILIQQQQIIDEEFIQKIKENLLNQFDELAFENYLKIQIPDDQKIQFALQFQNQQNFKKYFTQFILQNNFQNVSSELQIKIIEYIIKEKIVKPFDYKLNKDIILKLLQIFNYNDKKFIIDYLTFNNIDDKDIQLKILKSLKQITDKIEYRELILPHLNLLLQFKDILSDKCDFILENVWKSLPDSCLHSPHNSNILYKIFQLFLRYLKTKVLIQRLFQLENKQEGFQRQQYKYLIFDLIKHLYISQNKQNLRFTAVMLHYAGAKVNEVINIVGAWAILGGLRLAIDGQNVDNEKFDIIQNALIIQPVQQLVNLSTNGFLILDQLIKKDKTVIQMANSLNLLQQGLKVTIKMYIMIIQKVFKLQQKQFEQEFSQISQIDPQTPIIIQLSQLYLEIFKFDNTINLKQLPPIFKTKLTKQLRLFSQFLINFFPCEFLSLIAKLFIENDIDINIKSKFLEYFQELINSKQIRKNQLKIFKHLGLELLAQLKIQSQIQKPSQLYLKNILQVITSIIKEIPFNELIVVLFQLLQLDLQVQLQILIIFVLSLQSSNRDQFIPYIEKLYNTIAYILKQNELDLVFRSIEDLIKNLAPIFQGYFKPLILQLVRFQEAEKILILIGNRAEVRIFVDDLKEILKQNFEQKEQVNRLCLVIQSMCQKLDQEEFELHNQLIFKIFLSLLDKINYFIKQENIFNLQVLENNIYQAFEIFALKTNKLIMRKLFLQLVNWSDKQITPNECGFLYTLYRKVIFQLQNILYSIMKKLILKMNSLFVPFYTYVFENMIQLIQDFCQKKIKKGAKRALQETSQFYVFQNQLIELVLNNFQNCFLFDKEKFIDTQKFEQLAQILPEIFDNNQFPEINYDAFIDKNLTPCIIELFNNVADDYKWKTLIYNILSKLKSEVVKIRFNILKFLQKLIDALKDRFAVLIQDTLPFLVETLDDDDEQVEKISKAIVIQLEQVTGENIREYLKN